MLRWLSGGRIFAGVQEAYPHIGDEDIEAALVYAAQENSNRQIATRQGR